MSRTRMITTRQERVDSRHPFGPIPHDATCLINGRAYKIGLRGRPFIWNGDEWIYTNSINVSDVRSARPLTGRTSA